MAEKKLPKISIGIVSMTVILCVLCLTVFSALTLSTALSEQKLSEKRAEAVKEYYQAEVVVADLVNRLMTSADAVAFAEENHIKMKTEGETQIFYFGCPIDDGQELSVELLLDETWEIVRWQVVSIADWTPDESLNVWDGEMIFEE